MSIDKNTGQNAISHTCAIAAGHPLVSVIIPTYNRSKLLKKVLLALEAQSLGVNGFEVLVVDDGSRDDTPQMLEKYAKETHLNLFHWSRENKKQGAARNFAIEKANGPLLIFIGDDIVPESTFLESHLTFHAALEAPDTSSVIGYTTWPNEFRITPFMHYIGEFGHQFGYSLIDGNGPLAFNFYYTSNLLVPKALLNRLEYGFDEAFTVYGWEDIELGYRLEKAGGILHYNSEAVAYHYHETDVVAFCLRQYHVGKASRIFSKRHPELTRFLGDEDGLNKNATLFFKARIQKKVVGLLDKWLMLPFAHERYRFILDTYYAKGALEMTQKP